MLYNNQLFSQVNIVVPIKGKNTLYQSIYSQFTILRCIQKLKTILEKIHHLVNLTISWAYEEVMRSSQHLTAPALRSTGFSAPEPVSTLDRLDSQIIRLLDH